MIQESPQLSSLLLEIGTEDIPARFISSGIRQLKDNAETVLRDNHIRFDSVKAYGTPRRLAIIAEGIHPVQEDRTKEVFGPSKKIAFDENGKPTKATIGFANSQGVSVDNLIVKNKDKGEYIVAVIEEKGVHVSKLLPEILKKVILSLHFPKAMRWGNGSMRFVRPIRWILALFDKETLNFELDGIKSGNVTRGHRFLSPAQFQIKEITGYVKILSNNHVIVDPGERERIISEKAEKLSATAGGSPVKDEALLQTVVNLVEYPVPVLGSFPAEYLKLPKELLITVMKEHQKYFAVENSGGGLTNYFVITGNTNEDNSETVRIGAERVIRARFEDAKFYFEEDGKRKLEDRIDDLKNVTYQEKLGSLYDKILRIRELASFLSSRINPSVTEKAERAAMLSKTDLLTGVVREFPELQGIMGRYYAINDGEDIAVADALREQYLPSFQGDSLPGTETGDILSLADKIDNIISFFSIGLAPTGSEDPFALRRQALGVIAILLNKGYGISLKEIVAHASKKLKTGATPEVKENVLRFLEQRLEPLFTSYNYGNDVIQAALPLTREIPLKEIRGRLDALTEFKKAEAYNDFLTAIKRVNNIIPKTKLPALKIKLLTEEPEKKLLEKLNALKGDVEGALNERRYLDALTILLPLTEPINNFFDNVLVMDKREEIKANRLALLKDAWSLAEEIADFSKL